MESKFKFYSKKVNLLIIGAQRSGTTSLYNYLKQHKDIYMPKVKEIVYFVCDKCYAKGDDYYHSFFYTYNNNQKVVASAYVHMLPCEKSPERVKKYNPNMKFIVMLREPIERAYSAYNYAVRNGWESPNNDFVKTLELEQERLKMQTYRKYDLSYFYVGLYHKHLSNWLKYFPKENFLIFKDTDLRNNADAVMKKIFEFLDVDINQPIDTSKEYNKAGVPRFKWLQKFLTNDESTLRTLLGKLMTKKMRIFLRTNVRQKIIKFNTIEKEYPPLKQSERDILKKYFEEDLRKLKEEFDITFN